MRYPQQQLDCLRFIDEYLVEHEQGPTLKEVKGFLQRDPQWTVDILLARGMLDRIPGRGRSLAVTEAGRDELDKSVLEQ